MKHSENISELVKALLEAESKFGKIELNKKGTIKTKSGAEYSFKYADLAEVFNKTKPALRESGIKCCGGFETVDGKAHLTMSLFHTSGQWMKSSMQIDFIGSMTEKGGLITYLRRYAYVTLLGVVADEDVEGDTLNEIESQIGKSDKPINAHQLALLKNELKAIGSSEEQICRKAEIQKLEDLDSEGFKKLIKFIQDKKAANQ